MELDELKQSIMQRYCQKGQKITCAESCTGGMIAAALTDLPGSSKIFERGYITYSNVAKKDMLGILERTLENFGAVSEEIASEMAIGALEHSGADISIAVTGIAGPGGSELKPEGRVCFARVKKNGTCQTLTKEFGALGRAKVRLKSCQFALEWLLHED